MLDTFSAPLAELWVRLSRLGLSLSYFESQELAEKNSLGAA